MILKLLTTIHCGTWWWLVIVKGLKTHASYRTEPIMKPGLSDKWVQELAGIPFQQR